MTSNWRAQPTSWLIQGCHYFFWMAPKQLHEVKRSGQKEWIRHEEFKTIAILYPKFMPVQVKVDVHLGAGRHLMTSLLIWHLCWWTYVIINCPSCGILRRHCCHLWTVLPATGLTTNFISCTYMHICPLKHLIYIYALLVACPCYARKCWSSQIRAASQLWFLNWEERKNHTAVPEVWLFNTTAPPPAPPGTGEWFSAPAFKSDHSKSAHSFPTLQCLVVWYYFTNSPTVIRCGVQ